MNKLLFLSAALLCVAGAAPVTFQATPQARAHTPFPVVVPQPKQATYPTGILPLTGLSVRVLCSAPELTWAARDLKADWNTRLNAELGTSSTGKIVIGTVENAELAAKIRTAGLTASGAEGYALLVDSTGAYVVGADAKGAYYGTQTLRQLLTPQGLRFAKITDAPVLKQRIAMLYLDQYSKGVNDKLIPLLAGLKYNSVLIMSNYVQWDVAKAGGWAHPGGATRAEAKRVAELSRTYGLEPIPLIETPGHAAWMFYGGKNRDLVQDPDSKEPYAYDTLNPETFSRVIFPVLKEAVETFGAKTVHIGHDEVRNRDRFPARENGKAMGYPKLITDHIVKLHDYLKTLGAGTMMWHDSAFAEAVVGTVPAALPKDIQVAYWNYHPGSDIPMLSQIKTAGFRTLGASWNEVGNAEGMAQASVKAGIDGMIQTRWNGYFGNPSVWDGLADQGVAYVRAGNAFWNPGAKDVPNAAQLYRDLYQPTAFAAAAGFTADLKAAANRTLSDPDSKGWIQKGPDTDLSNLKAGVQKIGAYTFNISGAVMTKGARAAVADLPASITLDVNRKADAIAFLHTTGWASALPALNRELVGRYEIVYADGSRVTQPIEYGRHIRAWTDTVNPSMVMAPGWAGQTKDGLDINVPIFEWVNPKPGVVIKSITLVSEGKAANPTLLGLTLIGGQ